MLNIGREFELMTIAFFDDLKTNGGVEDRFAALFPNDTPRRKTPSVSDGVDFV